MNINQHITVCGIGPGHIDFVLLAVFEAVNHSELVVGGARQLEIFNPQCAVIEIKGSLSDVVDQIKSSGKSKICVLVSGDTGFNSFLQTINENFDNKSITVIPGISSYQYFFAKLGMTYENAFLGSVHGKTLNIIEKVRSYPLVFLLTDKLHNWKNIAETLINNNLNDCILHVGSRLSNANEQIYSFQLKDYQSFIDKNPNIDDSLCCVIIESHLQSNKYREMVPGIPDDEFIRGKVPMTKEEVRTVVLSKLKLKATDCLLDVGAGTGSVSIEAALLLSAGRVFAIEHKAEAAELIAQNISKFGVSNIEIVQAKAPEALNNIKNINKIFIGGSGGELPSILTWLEQNTSQGTRLVITAVSLETLELARKHLVSPAFSEPEIVQLSVSKVEKLGNSNMLRANTPVWIISGERR